MRSGFLLAVGVIFFFLVLSESAYAQQAVGRSVVSGKSVTLYDDGTWAFEGTPEQGCRTLGIGISFCGSTDKWKYSSTNGEDAAASFRYDDRHYAIVIVEELGIEDGLTQQFMRGAVVSNAATAANVPDEDIIVFSIDPYKNFPYPSETVIYGTSVDGVSVTYANTIVTKPHQAFQLITYAIGSDYTQQHKALHNDFVGSVELE